MSAIAWFRHWGSDRGTEIHNGAEELETLEQSIKAVVERNQLLTTKRPVEFIKRSTALPSLRIAM